MRAGCVKAGGAARAHACCGARPWGGKGLAVFSVEEPRAHAPAAFTKRLVCYSRAALVQRLVFGRRVAHETVLRLDARGVRAVGEVVDVGVATVDEAAGLRRRAGLRR